MYVPSLKLWSTAHVYSGDVVFRFAVLRLRLGDFMAVNEIPFVICKVIYALLFSYFFSDFFQLPAP